MWDSRVWGRGFIISQIHGTRDLTRTSMSIAVKLRAARVGWVEALGRLGRIVE